MVAVGPVLGGWLATDFGTDGWRLAFNINLPIGLIVLAGLWWWAKESKQDHAEKGVDILGALLSVIMFSTLVFGLIEGRTYGWWDVNQKNPFALGDFAWPTSGISVIPVALAIAVVSTTLFVVYERARSNAGKSVLLDLDVFKVASFRNGSIAALIISMGEFGVLFAIPLWLQNVLGLKPIESGTVLLALAGGAFLASGVSGAMSGKVSAAFLVRLGVALELDVDVLGERGLAAEHDRPGHHGCAAEGEEHDRLLDRGEDLDPEDLEGIKSRCGLKFKSFEKSAVDDGRHFYVYTRTSSDMSQEIYGIIEIGNADQWCGGGDTLLELSEGVRGDDELTSRMVASVFG
jgi:hypothetical protein